MIALIIFYPSPYYFAFYGIVRQLIYVKRHQLFMSTLVLAGTIVFIYGLYYVIDEIINFGIEKIYWPGFIRSPGYVLQHAAYPALGYFIGSLIVKVVQSILNKLPEIARMIHNRRNK